MPSGEALVIGRRRNEQNHFIRPGYLDRVAADKRFAAAVPRGDPRGYLVPLLTCLCLVIVLGDFDNVVYGAVRSTLVPGLVLALSMRRSRSTVLPPQVTAE